MIKTQGLKTLTPFYGDIVAGTKKFELRKNDRSFLVGDHLILKEYQAETKRFTGNEIKVKIIYLLAGLQTGLQPGFVILGIEFLD